MLSTLSGLRRTDSSVVEGTTGNLPTTVNNQSFIRRPSTNSIFERAPSFRQEGDMGRYVAFNDPGQPGAGFSNYQDYLDAGNPPVTNLVGPLGGAMIPEQGPLGPGLVGGIPPARDPGKPGGVQLPNGTGTQMPIGGIPITNAGIGSLTENPINTTPESSMTGSISSPYLNNNQDLDQYLNSYVENLINRRMRDIFGGIMSIFQ